MLPFLLVMGVAIVVIKSGQQTPTLPPVVAPTLFPTTLSPTQTLSPSKNPTLNPTRNPNPPTKSPSKNPTRNPTLNPTRNPTRNPSRNPTKSPSRNPTKNPTRNPTSNPTLRPTANPTLNPTRNPTRNPTKNPTKNPTLNPTKNPTRNPTRNPTKNPTLNPTRNPTVPTPLPTLNPTKNPTKNPTRNPTRICGTFVKNAVLTGGARPLFQQGAVDSDGNLWMTYTTGLMKLAPGGTLIIDIPLTFTNSRGVITTTTGRIFTRPQGTTLTEYDLAGSVVGTFAFCNTSPTVGALLAISSNGNSVFGSCDGSLLGVFTISSGTFTVTNIGNLVYGGVGADIYGKVYSAHDYGLYYVFAPPAAPQSRSINTGVGTIINNILNDQIGNVILQVNTGDKKVYNTAGKLVYTFSGPGGQFAMIPQGVLPQQRPTGSFIFQLNSGVLENWSRDPCASNAPTPSPTKNPTRFPTPPTKAPTP